MRSIHAVEPTRPQGQRPVDGVEPLRHRADAATEARRVDGVGRPKFDSTQVVTEPTPALYVKGCWPGSFVLQNFLSVSFTTPVACTVMVSPLAIVGEPAGAGVTVIFFVLRPLTLSQARALVQRCAATSVRAKRRAMIAILSKWCVCTAAALIAARCTFARTWCSQAPMQSKIRRNFFGAAVWDEVARRLVIPCWETPAVHSLLDACKATPS